jgi:signal peptidase II
VRDLQATRGTAISQIADAQPIERRRWRLLVAVVAVAGLTVDIVTKIIAVTNLEPLIPIRLLGGLLTLRLIRNPGAAFSQGQRFTYVFAIAGIVVLAFVIIKLVPRIGHPAWAVAIGLLCAGVAGNLTDRLFRPPGVLRGHVIDFLELPYWPVFNVADMCITSAAILIIFLSIVKGIAITGERHVRAGRRGTGEDDDHDRSPIARG